MFSVLLRHREEPHTSAPCASAYSARWLPTKPVIPVMRTRTATPRLFAENLDGDLARAGTVELREDDRLEAAEREIAGVDGDGDVAAEQRGAQVRVPVAPLA